MATITHKPRRDLRTLTPARVALETAGDALATCELLRFQLAHAQARDAVHIPLNLAAFAHRLGTELSQDVVPVLSLRTRAPDRTSYLRNPGLGRRLSEASAAALAAIPPRSDQPSLALVLADGLSARALEANAIPLLRALLPVLETNGWALHPITLIEQGRVAAGDEVGALLGATCTLMLLGERPGLTTPASLGAYLTWAPRLDRTDAERNCISNIHEDGLKPADAAQRIAHLMQNARALGATGVDLKEGDQAAGLLPS